MIVEISCEVRDRENRGTRQTFTTAVASMNAADIATAMQMKFNAPCVHPMVRRIEGVAEGKEKRKRG